MHHAVSAFGIAGLGTVVGPLGGVKEFLEGVGVAVLQEITGLLPAEDVVGGHAPRSASEVALAHEEFVVQRRIVEAPRGFAVRENGLEQASRACAAHEVGLIGRLVVRIAGREHHVFHAQFHHFVEEAADAVGIGAIEEGGVGGDAEATGDGGFDGANGDIVTAFTADREIVVLAFAIDVHGKAEVFAGGEEIELFFEQESVGAEVDVLFTGDQAVDNFFDLRMHERLAAGDGDGGDTAFFDCFEALFGAEVALQDVGGILNFSAASAGQVAAEEGFEHQDERVAFASGELLLEDVGRHGEHLGSWSTHREGKDCLSLYDSRALGRLTLTGDGKVWVAIFCANLYAASGGLPFMKSEQSDFVLDAVDRRNQDLLLDQALFVVDRGTFAKFEALVHCPLPPSDRLSRLLTTKAPWDK